MSQDLIVEQITPNEFAVEIEDLVRRHRMNYVDSVVHWAKEHDVNLEDISSLINSSLKSKLRVDYEKLNYLPKSNRLPI